jgi:hypothetical protein
VPYQFFLLYLEAGEKSNSEFTLSQTLLMQSEYKLVQVVQGLCHFARVTVEATEEQIINIRDEIAKPAERDHYYVDRQSYPDWVEAAVQGARSIVEALVRQRKIAGGRVSIVRVIGSNCDTVPEDVRCAVALATWQALNPDEPLPSFALVGQEWHIAFD